MVIDAIFLIFFFPPKTIYLILKFQKKKKNTHKRDAQFQGKTPHTPPEQKYHSSNLSITTHSN